MRIFLRMSLLTIVLLTLVLIAHISYATEDYCLTHDKLIKLIDEDDKGMDFTTFYEGPLMEFLLVFFRNSNTPKHPQITKDVTSIIVFHKQDADGVAITMFKDNCHRGTFFMFASDYFTILNILGVPNPTKTSF